MNALQLTADGRKVEHQMIRERNENIDFLRLISMFFVVCVHYVGWGGISSNSVGVVNMGIAGIIAVACNCAVNCFYMISGYMISGRESIDQTRRRIMKVWIPTIFYSVLIPALLQIFGIIRLDIKQNVLLFLPVMSNQYWFSTCFIAMAAILPFLSRLLTGLKKRELSVLLLTLIFLDCIQPMLGCNAFSNIGYGILHAVTMYVIGYYLKKYPVRLSQWVYALVFCICVGMIGAITILSMKLTGDRNRTIADYNSIIMVVQSMALFCFVLNLKLPRWRFSKIAPYVFGVYLLNDNQYARDSLWQKIFHCSDFYGSKLMILHLLLTCIGFMAVAIGIEWLRIHAMQWVRKIIRG